jgi:hypothetical protein
MSDECWTHTNWYATRLHIFNEQGPRQVRGYTRTFDWALCGCDVYPIEQDRERRANACRKAKDYSRLPHCKLCERKASAS